MNDILNKSLSKWNAPMIEQRKKTCYDCDLFLAGTCDGFDEDIKKCANFSDCWVTVKEQFGCDFVMKKVRNVLFIDEAPKILKDTIYENCSFTEYNFYRATIQNCIFINCNLGESNFSKANVINCKFFDCFIQFSAMLRVTFYKCEFHRCDFWHSNLCHSTIKECLFEESILKALYKDLNWTNNDFDEKTIIESCGGAYCCMDIEIIKELLELSKRTKEQ